LLKLLKIADHPKYRNIRRLSEVWGKEIIQKVFHHTMICRKSSQVGWV